MLRIYTNTPSHMICTHISAQGSFRPKLDLHVYNTWVKTQEMQHIVNMTQNYPSNERPYDTIEEFNVDSKAWVFSFI